MRSVAKKRRRGRLVLMTMCRNLSVHANCWQKFVSTCNSGNEFAAVHESASLIGRVGSSAFRLSTITVATSLAGSCFSTESAHGPFHHGIRGRGGTIFRATLPAGRSKRTHELTSSIVPRGTSFHHLVEFEFCSYRS